MEQLEYICNASGCGMDTPCIIKISPRIKHKMEEIAARKITRCLFYQHFGAIFTQVTNKKPRTTKQKPKIKQTVNDRFANII
jgi:hypothetical protein